MKIDFNNIYNQDRILLPRIIKDIKKLITKGNFILGKEVKNFEKNFSEFTKTRFCVGCASGSDALYLALKSLNLKKSDEVIIPDMTYIATASAVINNGCKLRVVDVNLDNASINQKEVIKKINSNTKAIIVVNLWGFSANYEALQKICKKKNICLIEDAAQSIGSVNENGINSGNLGDIACFSFFPGKNLGAYGDGGAVVTNNKKSYNSILRLRAHGALKKFQHEVIGINSRLDAIQATILNHKLKRIDLINDKRRDIANFYFKNIKNKKIHLFNKINNGSCFHQFVVLVKQRKKFTDYLKINNIPFGYHYPYSIHKLKAIKDYCVDKNFKNSLLISSNCVSLPIDPYLNKTKLNYIVKNINLF